MLAKVAFIKRQSKKNFVNQSQTTYKYSWPLVLRGNGPTKSMAMICQRKRQFFSAPIKLNFR